MRRCLAVVVALAAVGAASLATPPAHAASPVAASPPRAISWLAAGDSYTSGEGLPDNDGSDCQRANGENGHTSLAWPIVASRHAGVPSEYGTPGPALVACTGARSSEFFTPTRPDRRQWSPAAGRFDLVTFTFGGDDVGFASTLLRCLGIDPRDLATIALAGDPIGTWLSDPFIHCPPDSQLRQTIASFAPKYNDFLRSVANEAVTAGGNVVVLGYPEFVEDPRFWPIADKALGMCQGIRASDALELRGLAGDLNATIGAAVAAVNNSHPNGVHLRFVDVNTGGAGISYGDPNLFEPNQGARHNLCAASEWLNGLSAIHHGDGSFHPNQEGHDAMGALLAEVLPHLDWTDLAPPASTTAPLVARLGHQYDASGIVAGGGHYWFAVASQDQFGDPTTVMVYEWGGARWQRRASVRLTDTDGSNASGELEDDNGEPITTANVTGAATPDFLVHSGGADTDWLSVVSDAAGAWTPVPFDYSEGLTVGIDVGAIRAPQIEGRVDGCIPDCASGPFTYTWYRYHTGEFVPSSPPGPSAPCDATRLKQIANAADPGIVSFQRPACADGWALVQGIGFGAPLVALFEQRGASWENESIGPAAGLAQLPQTYAIPRSLLATLAGQIGVTLPPPPA